MSLAVLLVVAAVVLFILACLLTAPPVWLVPAGLACLAASFLPWGTWMAQRVRPQ